MEYHEWPAPPDLQRVVQCAWHLREDADAGHVHTVWPDGRCELIVHRGTPMRWLAGGAAGWQPQARTLFAAQVRSAIRLASTGGTDCVGMRLRPAASAAIAGGALRGLCDQVVDLATIDAALSDALLRIDADGRRLPDALWVLLRQRLTSFTVDARVETAVAALDATDGLHTATALARHSCCSVRTLQSAFEAQVGLSLKEYGRIRRLQQTLRLLDAATTPLAAVAADSGFADQAHATREVHRLTGLTPARLRHALRDARDGDRTLFMAAAFVRGHGSATGQANGRQAEHH